MTGQEVVTLTKDELKAWVRGDDIETVDQEGELDYAQAMEILTAETPKDALANLEVRPESTLQGTTFTVVSIHWRKGNKNEDGNNRYAFCRCADADGIPFGTSLGGGKVILQLRKFEVEGWLPATFTYESVETNSGRSMRQFVVPAEAF
jgi:hypothetical protein